MKKLMALMALTVLTACDYAERAELRHDRSDRLYQSAMDDYRSGRIDAAIQGFEKVLRKDAGNASARFQLACLQQDAKQDYPSAFCGYREYLFQHPGSDKAPLAKDRLDKCEKELAKALASRHGLLKTDGLAQELEVVRKELKAAQTRAAAAEKDVETLRARVTALNDERTRLLAIIKGGDDLPKRESSIAREAKDLLEEENEDGIDRIKLSKDAAALKSETESDLASGSPLLPPRTASAISNQVAAVEEEKKPTVPPHPATYEVQEGDTLYRIAKRFYGRLSAWKAIRDANKGLISADNRLRAGDVLKLP